MPIDDDEVSDIRLLAKVEKYHDSSVVSFDAYFVYATPSGAIRNPSWSTLGDRAAHLDNLRITAQADVSGGGWYGWDLTYREVYSTNLQRAESMVKTLRSTQRKIERIEARYGSTRDLFTYVARVGAALGVSTYGWTVTQAHSYDGSEFQWGGIDTLRFHVEQEHDRIVGVTP